jgi:hypothetical protein
MEKPNWVCVSCGMWSSRKYSVKRHILTVHGGNSLMVSFIEYVVGRQTGLYRPPFPPAPTVPGYVQSHQSKKTPDVIDKFSEEYWKERAKEKARIDSQSGV